MQSFLLNNVENLVASIDLGSNSFKLMIAKVTSINGVLHIEELDTIKDSLKLASGIDKNGFLSDKYIKKAYESLIRFGDRLRRFEKNTVIAIGTYTLRSVKNENFLKNAEKLLGFNIHIVSGNEEAELIYNGVMHVSPELKGKQLIIDIGGGSTEIIIGDRKKIYYSTSLNIGCVTFGIKYFEETKVTKDSLNKCIDNTKKIIKKLIVNETESYQNIIGTSGTCRAIADIIILNGLDTITNSPIDNIGGFITLKGLYSIRDDLIKCGDVSLSQLSGIKNDRRPVIASGLAILIAIFEEFKIKQMEVTESALLYGAIHKQLFHLIDSSSPLIGGYKRILPIESKNEIKNRCDEEIKFLGKKFYNDEKQTNRVYLTASYLSEKIINNKESKKILLWATQLLEIGKSINLKNYHLYSSYIISNSELHGFTNKQKLRLSTLVHAHRSSLTSYKINNKYIDWKLLFILRVSYILCKNRELINFESLDIQKINNGIKVEFKKEWLKENPYLSFRLEKEKEYWKMIDPKFKISFN